ncbi:hypothetical protein NIES4074_47250 [Cylindrospermum sp. NIES-4074]|nr:hypothetical protein NIES4074_47250 [Cylindrospermum sp. NIES-4074]
MYSRQHRISKKPSDSHDAPASNQFAPRPFVVQPQTQEVKPPENQTADLQAKEEKSKQVSDGFPDPAVFTRHVAPPKQPRIQMKLTIGKAGDKYEQEADKMAAVVQQESSEKIQQPPATQISQVQDSVGLGTIQCDSKGAANFNQITGEKLNEADAPDKLKLPPQLIKGMQDGWDKSFPGGKSQEQGGIIVKDKEGNYQWKPGKSGTSGSFTPNYGDQGKDDTLIGVGHTHPYDASEGGMTDVSFSGDDLARLVYVEDRIAVVQSGQGQFVAARTEEFNTMLKGLDEAGKKKMFDEINKTWDDTFKSAKGKFQERVEAAVKAVCSKYHLVYYKGKDGNLTK